MSMINEMVERLRSLARVNTDDTFRLLWGAANTIEDLSAKVRNNNLHGGWIPVSERLPREYAQYLVCFKTGHCYVYWLEDSDWARGMVEKEGILAWMPLPMPYREGGEEYELATEQMEHDAMYEPTYNSEDGSM